MNQNKAIFRFSTNSLEIFLYFLGFSHFQMPWINSQAKNV